MSNLKRNSSFVFSGYYGMNNFGDDLFAFVCASAAKLYWNRADVRLLSPSIPGLEANFAVPKIFSNELYATASVAGGIGRLMFAFREAYLNQLFILGGGSVISSQTSGVRNIIHKTSGFTKVNFAAMGISIGPFKSLQDQKRSKDFLSDFLFISVRDQASYRIAKEFELECPVVNAGDLAGLMPLLTFKEQKNTNKTEPVIGLALCPYESIVGGDIQIENERNKALVHAVIEIARESGARVDVFSLNNHPSFGDDVLASDICSQLELSGIRFKLLRHIDYGVLEIWRLIASCSFFVSVRLHGAIAAYLNKIPFVLVEYHKKCTDFLDDIGQCDNLRISGSLSESKTIAKIIAELLIEPKQPKMLVEQYTERALQHFSDFPSDLVSGR